MAEPARRQSEFDAYAANYKETMSHPCRRFVDPKDNYFVDLKCAEILRLIGESGQSPATLTVADIGCGLGDFEARLATEVKQLLAFDLSLKMLDVAHELAPFTNGGYTCADSVSLPLADNSVDVVFASSLFHHMAAVHMIPVVAEFHRICRPGGMVICFEHNPLNPVTQIVVRTTPIDQDARLMASRTVRGFFGKVGFRNVERRYLLFGPKPLDLQLRPFHPWLQRLPLGAQYMIVGRK